MKILRLGDPHTKIGNLEESENLLHFVLDQAIRRQVDRIEILGDLFHSHAVIRLEVLDFWTNWLGTLSEVFETVVLVGNHDTNMNINENLNALSVFDKLKKKNLKIVESTTVLKPFAYMAYERSNEKFVKNANYLADEFGATVLVCHQTLQGSRYENGFYAPDGVDSSLISPKYSKIISGHIHSKQEFGRVIYPGTAKWDTASDANLPKGITIFNHDDVTGEILNVEFLSTEEICTPIREYVWKEGEEEPIISEKARNSVRLIGSSEWISKQKKKLNGKASISVKITDKAKVKERQYVNSMEQFILKYFTPVQGMDKEKILAYMKELNLV